MAGFPYGGVALSVILIALSAMTFPHSASAQQLCHRYVSCNPVELHRSCPLPIRGTEGEYFIEFDVYYTNQDTIHGAFRMSFLRDGAMFMKEIATGQWEFQIDATVNTTAGPVKMGTGQIYDISRRKIRNNEFNIMSPTAFMTDRNSSMISVDRFLWKFPFLFGIWELKSECH